MSFDLAPVWLTLKLAGASTAVLLLVGTPLAWWLAHTRTRLRGAIEAVVALPLVLPPTVLGFYLLIALGADGPIGRVWSLLGGGALVFTFGGLVIGSVVYSLPFVVQPLHGTFAAIGRRPLEIAATLGASRWDAFFSVILPAARRGFVTAATLGFAHTVGEFGVVLMIGGSIPEETRVLSIAIYEHVEALEYAAAHGYSAGLLVFAFVVLLLVYSLSPRRGLP